MEPNHVHASENPVAKTAQDALRVQAAAVAAQQAALTEEEERLEQRRVALERQEEQLAAHLEDKRRQLLELQDQVRQARTALRGERAAHAERDSELESERRELQAGWQDLLTERKRLARLHRRLRHRWHTRRRAEVAEMERREEQLAAERVELNHDADQLRQEKETLAQARLRSNGETELGRRQLAEARAELSREQRQWLERRACEQADLLRQARELERREAALNGVQRQVHEQQRHWESIRLNLEKEAEGLENRVRNLRAQLVEQERQAGRRESSLRELQARIGQAPPMAPASFDDVEPNSTRLDTLERLAGDLADQRLHLAEQCEQLLRAEEHWQLDRAAVAAELEVAVLRLGDREQTVEQRERTVCDREQARDRQEAALRQRQDDIRQQQLLIDTWQARLAGREKTWEGERDRLHVQLLAGEDLVRQQLEAVEGLRRRWALRRRQEVDRLKAHFQHCRQTRAVYAALWQECQQRAAALEKAQRAVAERTLVLEQYRLECVGQAPDSAAAERHLDRLQRRCAAVSATAVRKLGKEREALLAEALRLDERARELQRQTTAILNHEAELTARQNAWEHEQHLAADADARLQQELKSLQAQRELAERQAQAVREELERVAQSLLENADDGPALAA